MFKLYFYSAGSMRLYARAIISSYYNLLKYSFDWFCQFLFAIIFIYVEGDMVRSKFYCCVFLLCIPSLLKIIKSYWSSGFIIFLYLAIFTNWQDLALAVIHSVHAFILSLQYLVSPLPCYSWVHGSHNRTSKSMLFPWPMLFSKMASPHLRPKQTWRHIFPRRCFDGSLWCKYLC